ncbi:MAG: hypothetical protein PWP27_1735 [Clostridiales bacterium]|jgi:hypothetical protein|nr:hypothetical protein [Clostridiales bacterium]
MSIFLLKTLFAKNLLKNDFGQIKIERKQMRCQNCTNVDISRLLRDIKNKKRCAEKLCDIFGFSKQIDVINRVEDWEQGIFHYEVKAILLSKRTDLIEAEGIGSYNNREKKYSNQHAYSIANTIISSKFIMVYD